MAGRGGKQRLSQIGSGGPVRRHSDDASKSPTTSQALKNTQGARNMASEVSSNASGTKAKENNCHQCGKKKGMLGLLGCRVCGKWYHPKCHNVSSEVYQAHLDDKSKVWVCVDCGDELDITVDEEESELGRGATGDAIRETGRVSGRGSPSTDIGTDVMFALRSIQNQLTSMSSDLNTLVGNYNSIEAKVTDIESTLVDMQGKVTELETRRTIFTNQDLFDEHLDSILKPMEARLKEEIKSEIKYAGRNTKAEIMDIQRRQKNLIIENPPGHSDAKTLVCELAGSLGLTNITNDSIKAINEWTNGEGTDTERKLMCVIFKHEEDKFKFLRKEVREKVDQIGTGHRFYGVKIYPDRSPAERKQYKEQKHEAEQKNAALTPQDTHKYIVSRGRVIIVPKTPRGNQ